MAKTTLICEQEQIHKLATLNCEFTRKYVHLDVLRHYPANNDTNLRIATFNVRMYNRLDVATYANHIPSESLLPTTSDLHARVVGVELSSCMVHNRC
jgi:hypothetical protein